MLLGQTPQGAKDCVCPKEINIHVKGERKNNKLNNKKQHMIDDKCDLVHKSASF